jgi:hypothetical protein
MEVSGLRPICYQRCVFLFFAFCFVFDFCFCFLFLNGMFKTSVGHYAFFLCLWCSVSASCFVLLLFLF